MLAGGIHLLFVFFTKGLGKEHVRKMKMKLPVLSGTRPKLTCALTARPGSAVSHPSITCSISS
jgi:hypothetical protein